MAVVVPGALVWSGALLGLLALLGLHLLALLAVPADTKCSTKSAVVQLDVHACSHGRRRAEMGAGRIDLVLCRLV